jgi:hypothetical protein
MSQILKLTGSLLIQLAEGAQPAPVPVGFNTTYTEKQLYGFTFTGAQSVIPVPAGTVTAPRCVIVFLYEGSISLSWANDGAGAEVLTANPSPPPNDVPVKIMFRYSAPTSALYISTTGAARGEIWLFE